MGCPAYATWITGRKGLHGQANTFRRIINVQVDKLHDHFSPKDEQFLNGFLREDKPSLRPTMNVLSEGEIVWGVGHGPWGGPNPP